MGAVGELGAVGNGVGKKALPAFEGFKDLTTKTLEKLKGKTSVSKQFIQDLTNAPGLNHASETM